MMNMRTIVLTAFAMVMPGAGCDSATEPNIVGALTLPGTATAPYFVRLLTTTGAGATTAAETTGTTNGTMTLTYSIANVPAGTYFMLAAVDVDKKKGITWAEAIRAYNGSGAHAEHYRAAVLKRAAEAAARKPGSPLIPSGI